MVRYFANFDGLYMGAHGIKQLIYFSIYMFKTHLVLIALSYCLYVYYIITGRGLRITIR